MRVLILAVLVASAFSLTCKNYLNYDGNVNHTESGKCLVTVDTNVYTTPCSDDGQFCDKDSGDCVSQGLAGKGLPGYKCAADSDCDWGKCVGTTNKVCDGTAENANCSDVRECDIGLYCTEPTGQGYKTCEKYAITKDACALDTDCELGLACIDDYCATVFTGAKDALCTADDTGLSYECESNYCDKTTGKCSDTIPKNAHTTDCTKDSECTTQVSSVTGTCACTIATTATARCSAQQGDDNVQAAYALIKKYIVPHVADVAANCQTTARWSTWCWEAYADADVFQGFQIAMLAYNQAVDPDIAGLALSKFSQDPLEALQPEDSQFIGDTTFQGHCDQYASTTGLTDDNCMTYNDHKYLIQACSTNDEKKNTCKPAAHSDAKCGPRGNDTYPQTGLDGDYCWENSHCKSNSCKAHRCIGLTENSECISVDDESCAAGLACKLDSATNKTKCQKQAAEKAACVNDMQCENGLLCVNTVCVQEFSVKSGETAVRACGKDDVSSLCETGQCVALTADTLTCIAGYATKSTTVPKQTTELEDCLAETTTSSYTHHYEFGTINCAKADTKYGSYCSSKLGDTLGKELVAATKTIRGKSQGKCHYSKQLDPYCWHEHSSHGDTSLTWTNFGTYYQLLERYNNYPSLETGYANTDTLQVYYPSYYAAKNYDSNDNDHYFDYPDSAGLLATLFALLMLLL